MPKVPIAMMLLGLAICLAVAIVQPARESAAIPLVIGSILFLLGLKVTIKEMPDIPVPTWLGLAIVIVLGLSLPAVFLVTVLIAKFT